MAAQRNSTRQRLVHAALELFTAQGVTETTTKQIAELADVNEVTIFRQFGNKHGLLLAVIEEAGIFTNLGQNLVQQASQASSIYQALKDYATACLQALEGIPEVVRSVVGESGQYPAQNREALGQGFTQANRYVAEYFATVINTGQLQTHLPAEKLASLLNGMLLGYAVIEFTSEFHELWQNREDFLENLVTLFLHGAVSQAPQSPIVSVEKVADLPAALVHSILQRAKKVGWQDYALMYVLFGAGLSAAEVVRLERSHYIKDTHQQLLQITQEKIRQVPLNQWIMGKRYGSYQRNPLTQWLKNRKDNQSALFLNENGNPLSENQLRQKWQALTADLLTPEGQPPHIEQSQQTWCVDMLIRGIDLPNLSILTGWDTSKLQPYVHRAKEKAALEQASRLDQKI
ncbi:TetR family transcriptional regulator [Floridanema evergladense]|uniref:TetR family transcriptional regulator n=1 Tax=Floridaenema evergladense BLCC-F167 TaxID=3153639 RepID=A0ABV4WRC4_9CYAN